MKKPKLHDPRARDLQTAAGWMLAAASAPAAFDGMMLVAGAGFGPIVVNSLEVVAGITGIATMLLMLAAKLERETLARLDAAYQAAHPMPVVEPIVVAPPARPAFTAPMPIYRPEEPTRVAAPRQVAARQVAPPPVARPWLTPTPAPVPQPAASATLPPARPEPSPAVQPDHVVAD